MCSQSVAIHFTDQPKSATAIKTTQCTPSPLSKAAAGQVGLYDVGVAPPHSHRHSAVDAVDDFLRSVHILEAGSLLDESANEGQGSRSQASRGLDSKGVEIRPNLISQPTAVPLLLRLSPPQHRLFISSTSLHMRGRKRVAHGDIHRDRSPEAPDEEVEALPAWAPLLALLGLLFSLAAIWSCCRCWPLPAPSASVPPAGRPVLLSGRMVPVSPRLYSHSPSHPRGPMRQA